MLLRLPYPPPGGKGDNRVKLPAVAYIAAMLYHLITKSIGEGGVLTKEDYVCCSLPAYYSPNIVALYHQAWKLLKLPGHFLTAPEPMSAVLALLFRYGLSDEVLKKVHGADKAILVVSDNGGGTFDACSLTLQITSVASLNERQGLSVSPGEEKEEVVAAVMGKSFGSK